jgi:predicted AAA+ superfamily ATPase
MVESPLPVLTFSDVSLPSIKGKAIAVIGMRRAGKTSFLHQCRRSLIEGGRSPERLLCFNFEDERLSGLKAEDLGGISDTLQRLYPEPAEETVTLFLDEIQLIDGWEKYVRRLLDTPGYEILISGSSAKLLSREIATSMRGRAWEIEMHPFSFREFLRHHSHEVPENIARLSMKKATALDHHFHQYFIEGGFPEAQGLPALEQRQLLQGYVDVLLLRDVIERHAVSNPTALLWMVRRLLRSPGGLFSVTKFAAEMKSLGIPVGRETLYEYLDHLQDAFLLHTIPIATDSEKRRQINPRKVYPADSGLITVYDQSGREDLGHRLETMVFIELRRRRAEVAYVKTEKGYEIDFRARHLDGREEFIQVCASVDDPETLAREVRALANAPADYHEVERIILTAETRLPFPEVPSGIRILPAWKWMLADR